MESRGGCCIARYAGGGGGAYDPSKMDLIMLKFRPIAPKPSVGGGSIFRADNEVCSRTGGRGKRRYVNNNSKNYDGASRRGCGRKRKAPTPEKSETSSLPAVVTLPLLPETPGRMESPVRGSCSETTDVGVSKKGPIWLSFGPHHVETVGGEHVAGLRYGEMMTSPRMAEVMVVVSSWVKVECITDTWVDAYGLGRSDDERFMNLHKDTCPGIISNGSNQVTWTNESYKEMIGCGTGNNSNKDEKVVVSLGTKDGVRLLLHTCPVAFTCRVKVFTSRNDKIRNKITTNSLTLPCDVWRMDNGGFAWRLDTKAALSLGR